MITLYGVDALHEFRILIVEELLGGGVGEGDYELLEVALEGARVGDVAGAAVVVAGTAVLAAGGEGAGGAIGLCEAGLLECLDARFVRALGEGADLEVGVADEMGARVEAAVDVDHELVGTDAAHVGFVGALADVVFDLVFERNENEFAVASVIVDVEVADFGELVLKEVEALVGPVDAVADCGGYVENFETGFFEETDAV